MSMADWKLENWLRTTKRDVPRNDDGTIDVIKSIVAMVDEELEPLRQALSRKK